MKQQVQYWRDWLASQMEIDEAHKQSLYLDIAQGATLLKVNYWLELIAAAGIATLGLTLNSPAVIIGAMLISPLMSPILAMGLSLAAGDFILAIRSVVNLILSSVFAILLAITLVYFLPFKEVTTEIANRTNPNLLDLVVALFSGAIGSLSTCKPVKGIVNAIPGVAIAVALMPPLCVVGYGIGISASHNFNIGIRVATGGGLLFITNLVTISFMAMLVFLLLHIDTDRVKETVREWNCNDRESQFIQNRLRENKLLQNLRLIDSLPGRLVMILGLVLLLAFPLTESINRLSREVSNRNDETRIRRTVQDIWNKQIALYPNGETRSYINKLILQKRSEELVLNLTTFTSKPVTPQERQDYINNLATALNKPADKILLNLVEIPITQFEEQPINLVSNDANLKDLLGSFTNRIDQSIRSITLPAGKQLVGYKLISDQNLNLTIQISYLADRVMSDDAQDILETNYIESIPLANVGVDLIFLDGNKKTLAVSNAPDYLLLEQTKIELDRWAQHLNEFSDLFIEISIPNSNNSDQQIAIISSYLREKHQISMDRLIIQSSNEQSLVGRLTLR